MNEWGLLMDWELMVMMMPVGMAQAGHMACHHFIWPIAECDSSFMSFWC